MPFLSEYQSFYHFLSLLAERFKISASLIIESIAQSGNTFLASFVSKRYRLLDEPIVQQFSEDYNMKMRFRDGFPNINTVLKARFI